MLGVGSWEATQQKILQGLDKNLFKPISPWRRAPATSLETTRKEILRMFGFQDLVKYSIATR
jgi:hypothetical protein